MSAPRPEFRYFYFTPLYDDTVAFYRDRVRLEEVSSWDRGPDERGTVFRSPNGMGLIEVEAGDAPGPGGGIYIEMNDVDAWHAELVSRGVPIATPLTDTSYGHRQFRIVDPAGLEIGFFSRREA